MEMRCQRSMKGVTRMDQERNGDVRRGTEVCRKMANGVEQVVLRWVGHVVRIEEDRLIKISKSDVRGTVLKECNGRIV